MHTAPAAFVGQAPQLLLYGNTWALGALPRQPAPAWSLDEALERLVAAGYAGCQGSLAEAAMIRRHGLRFAAATRFNTVAEAEREIAAAVAAQADCLTVHAGWGYEEEEEIVALLEGAVACAAKHRLPLYIETHRATVLENMWRTRRALARVDGLWFNGDFSHYYCGSEIPYSGRERALAYLDPIFARTGFIHGRISDSQAMQCEFTAPRHAEHRAWFEQAWSRVFAHWKGRARAGDVFIFCPELGPPESNYSQSYRTAEGAWIEAQDRWALSAELVATARRLFAAA
jgi:hypothetical protein